MSRAIGILESDVHLHREDGLQVARLLILWDNLSLDTELVLVRAHSVRKCARR